MSNLYSHRKLADNVFIEIAGVNFEDFEVGQVFEHRPGRTFTAEENRRKIMRSADLTMRNADAFYNQQVYGGEERISEALILTVVTSLTTKTFNKVVRKFRMEKVTFPHPVLAGDTVYANLKC